MHICIYGQRYVKISEQVSCEQDFNSINRVIQLIPYKKPIPDAIWCTTILQMTGELKRTKCIKA